jgi:hypothetical protein
MRGAVRLSVAAMMWCVSMAAQTIAPQSPSGARVTPTPEEAIKNAKQLAPQFTSAQPDCRVTELERSIKRSRSYRQRDTTTNMFTAKAAVR